ncbi:Ff.00g004720.m01.CDS01 [Fusarium sp. VM40]|nr:Ff.00g004720.m01.CDS01 [Fusarium sp. VM40]
MTIARQTLSTLRRLPTVASAIRTKPMHATFSAARMYSGKVKTPVSSDINHDKKPVSTHTDGATASLKAAPGKDDATSFGNKNMSEKERKINSQNAQESDSKEGMGKETDTFTK